MLIILSGPPGAGKSTVAELLAEKFPHSAQFSIDTIRQFVKGGNLPPWDVSEEAVQQMKLGDDIVQDIIKRYLDNNYIVVLDGIYGDQDILKYRSVFGEVRGFLLLPDLEVLKQRDKNREQSKQMPHRIEPLYQDFKGKEHKLFTAIDNSQQTEAETVEYIWDKLNQL